MHTDTRWVKVRRSRVLDNRRQGACAQALRFQSEDGDPFAFSCLPYTAAELESAFHQEELPPARRTVLCVYSAVRGVGGIDSWGSDVEPAYRISAEEEHVCRFRILPI